MKHSDLVQKLDTVLDIRNMIRVGPRLGSKATLVSVKNVLHDILD